MKLWLIAASALSALYLLEPRTIYLDGVKPRVMRYERADWRMPPRPLTQSEAMLIGAPRNTVTVTWP